MISSSSVRRVRKCPGSEALPHANTHSEYAEMGTLVHRFVERARHVGRNAALAELAADLTRHHGDDAEFRETVYEICETLDLDEIPPVSTEVKMIYDVASDTAREVGRGSDRDYGDLGPMEIPGTADLAGIDGGAVYVGDLKSLWGDVPAAEENDQLALLALAASRIHGRDEALVQILRRREDGSIRADTAELDMLHLDAFAEKLRAMLEAVAEQKRRVAEGGVPDVVEGSWCRYCPAKPACPAKTALIRRMATGEEWSEHLALRPLTPELAAAAYKRLAAAKELLKEIERAIYATAREQPIPLGDGMYLGEQSKLGNEQLDGDVAWQVLADFYDPDAADEAVTRSATKKAVRAAIKKRLEEGEKLAPAERAVLGAIREQGGISRKESVRIVEYRAELPPANEEAEVSQEDAELLDGLLEYRERGVV